ncbi:MAG: O-antigen ligase family protein [bacterium]
MKKDQANNNWLNFDFIIEIIFLIVIFFVPTIFDRRLGIVFSGTKVAWMRGLVVIILGLWSLKIIITKEHRFIRTALDWPILAFLLTTTIATLTSVGVYTSFAGFYGRFEGLTTWYILGLLFFITTNYIHSAEQVKRVLALVIPVACIMSLYSIIQRHDLDPYMWGGVPTKERVIGTIGQPNFNAAYVLMAFFLGLVFFLEKRSSPKVIDWQAGLWPLGAFLFSQVAFIFMIYNLDAQDIIAWYLIFGSVTASSIYFAFNYNKLPLVLLEIIIGLSLLLNYINLLYTQSRGGYLGIFAGAVLFGLILGRQWLFTTWKKTVFIVLAIVAISAYTMMQPGYSPFERFTNEIKVDNQGETSKLELKGAAGSRGETWKSAFCIIADNPVFGVGPEVLKMVFPRYETELFRFREAFHVKQDRCHNETMDVPVTKGLISLGLYIYIIFLIFKLGIAKAKNISEDKRLVMAGLLAAILAFLVQNQFSFGVVAITSLFWVLWGCVMVMNRDNSGETAKFKKISFAEIPWLSVAAVVILFSWLFYASFLSFRADIDFKSGKNNLETRNFTGAEKDFKSSLKVLPLEGNTISHLAITYLNTGKASEAIKELNYGAKVDPYNADNFFMLARVYFSLNDQVLASKNIEIALKIDPYYAEVYELKGDLLARQGNLAAAATQYEKALVVNPTLPSVIRKVVDTDRRLNQLPRAKKLLAEMAEKIPDNIDLFKAYEQLK